MAYLLQKWWQGGREAVVLKQIINISFLLCPKNHGETGKFDN